MLRLVMWPKPNKKSRKIEHLHEEIKKLENKEILISAIIVAKDEEKKVGDCLKSVEWVNEIILVDSGSTDKTMEIAKKHGASVFKYKGGSYSDWRKT